MFKRYWWMFFVMVPLGSIAGLLVAAVITYMMPKQYESEAIIEVVRRDQPPGMDTSGSQAKQQYATETEILKSRKALEQVAANLELPNRWNVDKETAIHILKGMVETRRINGTDLLSIRARHTNRIDARDIAGEIVSVHKAHRAEADGRESERDLQKINEMIREQEDKVEERRKVLATFLKTQGMIDAEDGQTALHQFHQLEQEKMQLESQIGLLLKYDNDQLMAYAAGLDLPDNLIRSLHPQYLELKRTLDGLKTSGLSHDHPSVRATVGRIEEMKKQLDEGVVNLRATLHARLDLTNARLKSIEIPKSNFDARAYVGAKREFETDQELLQQMKLKLMGEKISRKMASDGVQIHDEPVIAQAPISPNVTLNLLLGAGLGFLFSPLMALPLMWLLNRRRHAQTAA